MRRAFGRAAASRSSRRIHATKAALSTASNSWPPSPSPQHEDWREVGVFWDMENCAVPSKLDPFFVRPNIERALRISGFLGPISLAGYANVNTICRGHTLESLSESGISIRHVPTGGRDASDRVLLMDVMFWTMKHNPPAHILLITGDTGFSVLMHKLWSLGYDVLLAAPQCMPPSLLHAASKIWMWPDVIVGESSGLTAQSHTPGMPLPKTLLGKSRDFESNKLVSEDNFDSGKMKLQDGGWLPPYVADRIANIVKGRPGITLRDLVKELKAIDINPKIYGYNDYYDCFSRMDQLETQFIEGVGMKDGVTFSVLSSAANRKSGATILRNEASRGPRKDADRKEGADGNIYALGQRLWGSWLARFMKGR